MEQIRFDVRTLLLDCLEQVKPWQTSGCKGVLNFEQDLRLFIGEDEAMRPFGEAREDVTRAFTWLSKKPQRGLRAEVQYTDLKDDGVRQCV